MHEGGLLGTYEIRSETGNAGTGMYRRSLGRPGWAIPNRSGDGVSDKSARIEGARAGAPHRTPALMYQWRSV